ncbi:type II secretion system F family protein [Salinithrix halophila]|uniref:Type II secretion system F family protein n=1 Tax=Salinithrix halophila TaxID=1485204 RepID=A0ABV8JHP9_9BACL
MILYILVGASWLCLVMAGLMYVSYREKQAEIAQRIEQQSGSTFAAVSQSSEQDWRKTLVAWFDRFAPIGKDIELLSDPEDLKEYLVKAGYPYGMTVDRLQGAKVVFAIGGTILGLFYFLLGLPLAPFMLAFSPLIGYLYPIYAMKSKAKKRQEEIQYDLPDFLDMMSITLKAGMSLDTALDYYVRTNKGPLSEEIGRMSQEVSFGVQRETAYRALMERTDSPELETLIQSIIQAHNLGTPLSETFTQQAMEMRSMRAEKAKEKAGKSEPKISAVAGLVITPSIMILIFGAFVLKFFFADDSPLKGIF